jgi:hypothetical protein
LVCIITLDDISDSYLTTLYQILLELRQKKWQEAGEEAS